MDSPNWELEASPAGARLGLTLGLSTLATARHVATDLKGLKNLASNTSLGNGIQGHIKESTGHHQQEKLL